MLQQGQILFDNFVRNLSNSFVVQDIRPKDDTKQPIDEDLFFRMVSHHQRLGQMGEICPEIICMICFRQKFRQIPKFILSVTLRAVFLQIFFSNLHFSSVIYRNI